MEHYHPLRRQRTRARDLIQRIERMLREPSARNPMVRTALENALAAQRKILAAIPCSDTRGFGV